MTDLDRAAAILRETADRAEPIVFFTGAGISEESGIPTFRGANGIWQQYDPEQVATAEGFRADPELSWRFHETLREMCRASTPNSGHLALAWVQEAFADCADVAVITQNIDGLHQAAGSNTVVELHGSCHRMRCTECEFSTAEMPDSFEELPPLCECGSLLRPDVVWFGEQLPREAMADAQRWAQDAGVMVVIGTSATVQPAASLPVIALRAGASVVEINCEPTPLSAVVDISLRGAAGDLLPALAEATGGAVGES
jgi:NAD-dependent deacetylase